MRVFYWNMTEHQTELSQWLEDANERAPGLLDEDDIEMASQQIRERIYFCGRLAGPVRYQSLKAAADQEWL